MKVRRRYQPDPDWLDWIIDPWAKSKIARPVWMTAMINKWQHHPPRLPLRETFHYPSARRMKQWTTQSFTVKGSVC